MDKRGSPTFLKGLIIWIVSGMWMLALAILVLWASPVQAQTNPPASDSACILCHVGNEETLVLPSGEILDLNVDLAPLQDSVHGKHETAATCTDCHSNQERYRYPHKANPAQNLNGFRAAITQNCEQCHTQLEKHNPGHLQAAPDAAVPNCIDCHGGHEVGAVATFNTDPVATCQSCHQSYDDPQMEEVHAEIVANLAPEQTCLACHGDQPQTADAQCKTCHNLLNSQLTLASGETVELHVNPDIVEGTVHGDRQIEGVAYTALQCTSCHQDEARNEFPHPKVDAESRRALTIEMEPLCQSCHAEIYELQRDSVHAQATERGVLEAATCVDCHGNHVIHDANEPRQRISQTCSQCHSTINEQYEMSVHGAALLGENNPDVPVCTDCHGVHNIHDPTTAEFRTNSPTLCASCHADEEIMGKYDISTKVFDTYVADFHGTTVQLFEKQEPGQETNKAVCYDCHGIHNILPVNDEHSQVIKENLLTTCRQCHPDATSNFPDAWTSHFEPSVENNPLVYWINLFYQILIPTVVGGFLLFIGTDAYRRVGDRWRKRKVGAE